MLSHDGLDFLRRNPEVSGWIYTSTLRGAYDRADRPLGPEYQHPGTQRRLAALRSVAAEHGMTPGQTVLTWLGFGHPALTSIVGVSTVAQVEQAWSAVTTTLDADAMATLDGARV